MDFLDGIAKLFTSEKLWSALVPAAVSTIGGVIGGSSDREELASEKALDRAFAEKQLAQQKELALASLAARGGGDGGSGAALIAARLTDARERERMKMEGRQAALSGRLKAIDFLSPATLAAAGNARTQAALQGADNVAAAYRAAGQMINPAFRAPMPTFG